MLYPSIVLRWPGLEGVARNPGASFTNAQSSPGHPTRILRLDKALVPTSALLYGILATMLQWPTPQAHPHLHEENSLCPI